MAVKMLKQAIDFTCEVAQGNLVNRGVDSLFDSLSGKHNSDSDIENMESNFSSLMARAHDLLIDIRTKEQGGIRKRKKEVEVWFEGVEKVEGDHRAFQKGKGVMKQIFCGDEAVMKLNERIRELVDQSRHFGELVVGDDNTSGLPRPTSELEGAAFQDNFQRIWELLENDQVSSIGVHGMGGVGKSTLVEHIHNQLLERNICVFWVVVSSQRCSIKMLQDKIACKLGLDLSKEDDDVGARAGRLKHALSHRENFVLILDDMWESFDLKKVGVPLSMKGCKWMVTSRSLNVCREMNCREKIGVKPLLKDEGWNLFLKNLGQDATAAALGDPEVEGIAKHIVEFCDGLPLGIITLAGALSGATEIQEWRHALRVLKESAMEYECMEEKVFPVLKYSFDRLNPNDQRCFLYCSLYPEDWHIPIEELLRDLISEKLVDERRSRATQCDEGHSILARLVKVSLLESVYDPDNCEFVKMHDLVRGLAHKITKGKTMVITGDQSRKNIPTEEEWAKDLEKVSLMINSIEKIPDGISPHCPKLTTLLLQGNELTRIATSFFWQMCGLHTLNLSHTLILELPDSVCDLVNLTSLLLGHCEMLERVPCVRKLKKLRELDLSHTLIQDVPEGMEELRLQLLRLPYIIEAELFEGVGERLEVFEGRLKHVTDFNRLFASKQDPVSFAIAVGDYGYDIYDRLECRDVGRELYAKNLKGREGNELTAILAVDYIHYMEFVLCPDMSKCLLDNFTNPTSLNRLKISNCGGIECILTNDQFKAPQQSKPPFQALEEIELFELEDFMGVIHKLEIQLDPPPSSPFPSLRNITITDCGKIKKLGLPLGVFEKLEYVTICYCEEIEEIIQVDDESLHISLPNLKDLELSTLPSLKCFGRAPVICNLLEDFTLEDCPRLEEPFLYWGTPHSNYNPLFPGHGVEEIRGQSL